MIWFIMLILTFFYLLIGIFIAYIVSNIETKLLLSGSTDPLLLFLTPDYPYEGWSTNYYTFCLCILFYPCFLVIFLCYGIYLLIRKIVEL